MKEIKINDINYKLYNLTKRTTVIEVSNYLIAFNKETNKLRVFDKTKIDKSKPTELDISLIFNSEDKNDN